MTAALTMSVDEALPAAPVDTGLRALAIVARVHGVACEPEQMDRALAPRDAASPEEPARCAPRGPAGPDRDGARTRRPDAARDRDRPRWQAAGTRRHRLAAEDAERGRRQAELASVRESIAKLEQTVPIARQRAADLDRLRRDGCISQHGFLEREQVRLEAERDLAVQKSRAVELEAGVREAAEKRRALVAEFERAASGTVAEAAKRAAQHAQDQVKATHRESRTRLVAPVAGTVQQLAVHTEGGVVQPGPPVTVKVETFPFTRYGTLPGRIVFVSRDAVADERRGLVFTARVRLERSELQVEQRAIRVSPGMAVSAEIKTGERRVIEYVLAPLMQTVGESARER